MLPKGGVHRAAALGLVGPGAAQSDDFRAGGAADLQGDLEN